MGSEMCIRDRPIGVRPAAQSYYQYIAGHTAGLELNGLPTLPIDYE